MVVLYDVLHGRMEDRLPEMPDGWFDSCVTDPPYELGFMGKGWDSSVVGVTDEVEHVEIARARVERAMREAGHL